MTRAAGDLGPNDLEACAAEPIHIPGRTQEHGVLLTLGADRRVRQVSANARSLLAREPDAVLGRPVADVLGARGADTIDQVLRLDGGDGVQTMVSFAMPEALGGATLDAVLHATDGVIVVELLRPGARPRPITFTDTYRRAQASIARLDASATPGDLLRAATEEVRRLTGFDRVMAYRFDADYNGEVVAEQRREGLEPFLGLRYPASDIPPQARALYERSWLRLIADVHGAPAELVPVLNPLTERPLDLSRAWLRAVSPIHIEYLKNMGVRASMSVSLLREGKLWGLIACHHYASSHEPDYETCATVELLAQLVSSRLVDRLQHEHDQRLLEHRATLTRLAVHTDRPGQALVEALTAGEVSMLDLVPADGVVACFAGHTSRAGAAPSPDVVAELVERAGDQVTAWDDLALGPEQADVGGALVVPLGPDGHVLWLRREVTRFVDWGGDPYNKVVAAQEPEGTRIGPRQSFDRWREEIDGRSLPWTDDEVEAAGLLRAELIEALYARARRSAAEALTLQLSLLPDRLPEVDGWELAARYMPAAGGRVGGDWYDALRIDHDTLAVVIGDVTGHGLAAAGTMAQLRNALRAYLVDDPNPVRALARLDRMTTALLPDQFTTCMVVVLTVSTGRARVVSYGHPPAVLAVGGVATHPDIPRQPSLGLAEVRRPMVAAELTIPPGADLVLVTDGMIERRGEHLDHGLDRLRDAVALPGRPEMRCEHVAALCRDPASEDDATVVAIRHR